MTQSATKNLSASVHQLLRNQAHSRKRSFNELLQFYAIERFLYRLSKSPVQGSFVLKGALMLAVWRSPRLRPTMDIDLLGKVTNDMDAIAGTFREVCMLEVEPDGMTFDADSITIGRITEDAEYEGVRVLARGNLSTAKVHI